MSTPVLPKLYEPYRLADKNVSFEGAVALVSFERFTKLLESSEGEISVKLHFFVDEEGNRLLEGNAQGSVKLICQRCLEPMDYDIEADFNISFAFHEEMARSMTGRFDPVVLSPDKRVSLVELIEDDLLLSLPMFSNHSDGECQVKTVYEDQSEAEQVSDDQEKSNPFSILANLKRPE